MKITKTQFVARCILNGMAITIAGLFGWALVEHMGVWQAICFVATALVIMWAAVSA